MAGSVARPNTGRTGSAKWGRPRSVHVTHPTAQRSFDLDLTIRGTPTPGLEQESARIIQWPPEHLLQPGRSRTTVPKTTAWRTDNQLFEQVKEKLTTGYDGVRQLFKAKDPYGDSIVTREGLFSILRTLVGHISRDQFESFLKTICLHWRTSISFDEFIVRFQDNPAVALHGLPDSNQMRQKQNHLEENLRSTDMLEWCPFSSAPHAFVVFRKKLQKGELNIRDLLPPNCFTYEGRVIAPQLREALAIAGIRLTDTEFDHIWQKFDTDNNGSMPIKRFYKTLNLSPNGLPKSDPRVTKSAHPTQRSFVEKESVQKQSQTEMKRSSRQSTSVSKVDSVEICGNQAEIIGMNRNQVPTRQGTSSSQHKVATEVVTTTKEVETTTTRTTTNTTTERREEQFFDDSKLSSHVRALIRAKKSPPQFDNIMDHLHYKFEETYRNFQSAFYLFDFMNDGYIAKIDFRRVLREFGFEISAIDLDSFLATSGISVVQGLVNYRQFLQKFQSRDDSSVFSKVISRNGVSNHHQTHKRFETEETLRVEEVEDNVSNFFHSDYLKLLGLLKQKDKNNTGIVAAPALRSAINSVLKTNMSDAQFDELIYRLSENSSNGSPQISYNTFLDLFNSDPGQWNKRKDGLFVGQKYQLGEILPSTPVQRLIEKAKTMPIPSPNTTVAAKSRVAEVKKELTRLFTDRFHIFDKNFQDMDRKRSGYMTKWQFGALLKLCGITLTVKDLDFLWAALDTRADNTLSYATLVKTFIGGQEKQQQKPAEKPSTAKSCRQTVPAASIQKPRVQRPTATVEQPRLETGSAKERRLTELIKKIKDDVLARWDVIYSIFLNLDRDGYSSISVQDMRDIAFKMKFPLTATERDELCNFFDLRGNGWFYYLSFLHAVKRQTSEPAVSSCVFNIHTKRLHRKAGPTSMAITVYDFLSELKGILLKKFKTLRGSFKFFDHNHNGYIEEGEMKKSFSMLGYALSPQDFLDILQIFDRGQGQHVTFEDFKATLLTI